ncbi:MAG: regulatory protein RecX [Agathobacter sp.]|nr:regulatory protein RecX [Agathobacter sp.]
MVSVVKCEAVGKGRIRVQFDTGITGIFYRGEALKASLSTDVILSDEEYEILLRDVLGKRAAKRAMHLLEQMDRTEKQLRDKLKAGEYPECCIDQAVEYVKRFHYLDDRRYAENYIRFSQNKMSRRNLSAKLMQKGISRDIVELALEEGYESDESKQIQALLEKKHYNPEVKDEGEFRRIYQYLMRRGFRSSDILREMKSTIY